jgi:class 3 adenylate cyclase
VRAAPVRRDPHRTIRTLMFADIVGYGRLPDSVIPGVQRKFWNAAARELAATATPARFANTWGDGLYAVFDAPRDGASFALRLADAMGAIRIALHTGPVYAGHDPVIGRDNYFGASVTQEARVEPITPPGTVYTTATFAATLAADGERDYALEYVGKLALAKGHGESRIYRVSTGS